MKSSKLRTKGRKRCPGGCECNSATETCSSSRTSKSCSSARSSRSCGGRCSKSK